MQSTRSAVEHVSAGVHFVVPPRGHEATQSRKQDFCPYTFRPHDGLTISPKADVIVTDLLLPGDMEVIEFIARLKRHDKHEPNPGHRVDGMRVEEGLSF
jgi:hypothetical protein